MTSHAAKNYLYSALLFIQADVAQLVEQLIRNQ
jgi:hypothetical protein